MELREGSSSRSTTEVAGSTGDRVARTVAFDSTNFARMESHQPPLVIFPNIEGLGVGDTGRPLGSGIRRAPPRIPIVAQHLRWRGNEHEWRLVGLQVRWMMFCDRGVISKREGVKMTQQQ